MKGCNQCSQVKKWCSLKNKNPSIPCNYCKDNGMTCTFEPFRRRNMKHPDPKSDSCVQKAKDAAIRETKATTSSTLEPSKAIWTKIAHPINFNYEPVAGDPSPSCHWCHDLVYGLLGLGEIEVEVRVLDGGRGYIEIDDGHVAAGYAPSRMCDFCTFDRIKILSCKGHEIQPIEGMDPETFDYSTVLDMLEPGKAASAPFIWCSICPAPAFFACGTRDDIGSQMGEAGMEEDPGCGLMLCESCAVSLVNDHDNNLEGLLDKLRMDEEDGGFNMRADADFLHPKGELMRRMRAI